MAKGVAKVITLNLRLITVVCKPFGDVIDSIFLTIYEVNVSLVHPASV